jgi:hypothetical protein
VMQVRRSASAATWRSRPDSSMQHGSTAPPGARAPA